MTKIETTTIDWAVDALTHPVMLTREGKLFFGKPDDRRIADAFCLYCNLELFIGQGNEYYRHCGRLDEELSFPLLDGKLTRYPMPDGSTLVFSEGASIPEDLEFFLFFRFDQWLLYAARFGAESQRSNACIRNYTPENGEFAIECARAILMDCNLRAADALASWLNGHPSGGLLTEVRNE